MSMDWKEHDRQSDAPQGQKSKISAALVAWIVLAVLAVVFILQNTRNSKVTFLFWDGTVSIWIVIVIAIVLGVLLDRLGTWFVRRRRGRAG
jgi:uncharacterized integral membrane protein